MNNMKRCVIGYSAIAVCAYNCLAQYTYMPIISKPDIQIINYYSDEQINRFLREAGEKEHSGQKNDAKAIRYKVDRTIKALENISQNEIMALRGIWNNVKKANLSDDIYFDSVEVSGSVARAVSVLSPCALPGDMPSNIYCRVDVIMQDVCSLTNLIVLSLRNLSVNNDSIKMLTRLKQLEYLEAPRSITDEELVYLLREIPTLQYVSLYGCESITGKFALDENATRNLREIEIIGTQVNNEQLGFLVRARALRYISLERMNIYMQKFPSIGLPRSKLKRRQ